MTKTECVLCSDTGITADKDECLNCDTATYMPHIAMSSTHRGHKVLGRFCWTCNLSTKPGVPGWHRPHKDESRHIKTDPLEVIWADGNGDSRSTARQDCYMCMNSKCNMPAHYEAYKEIVSKVRNDINAAIEAERFGVEL